MKKLIRREKLFLLLHTLVLAKLFPTFCSACVPGRRTPPPDSRRRRIQRGHLKLFTFITQGKKDERGRGEGGETGFWEGGKKVRDGTTTRRGKRREGGRAKRRGLNLFISLWERRGGGGLLPSLAWRTFPTDGTFPKDGKGG